MLKYSTRRTVDLQEWDGLVQETYGRPYSFQQQDGCKSRGIYTFTVPGEAYDFENDTLPEVVNSDDMGVSFKAWLARDPKQALLNQKYDWTCEMWWQRNFYPSIEMIANDLHARGLIEPGTYTIIIDW